MLLVVQELDNFRPLEFSWTACTREWKRFKIDMWKSWKLCGKGWQQQNFLTAVFHDANSTLDCENRLHSIHGQQASRNSFIHLTQQTVFGSPCHMAHIPATIRMATWWQNNNRTSAQRHLYTHTHTHTHIYTHTHAKSMCSGDGMNKRLI